MCWTFLVSCPKWWKHLTKTCALGKGRKNYVVVLTGNLQGNNTLATLMSRLFHLLKLKHLVILFQHDKELTCLFLILFSMRKTSSAFCLTSYVLHSAPHPVPVKSHASMESLLSALQSCSQSPHDCGLCQSLVALPTDPKLPLNIVMTSILKDSSNFLLM